MISTFGLSGKALLSSTNCFPFSFTTKEQSGDSLATESRGVWTHLVLLFTWRGWSKRSDACSSSLQRICRIGNSSPAASLVSSAFNMFLLHSPGRQNCLEENDRIRPLPTPLVSSPAPPANLWSWQDGWQCGSTREETPYLIVLMCVIFCVGINTDGFSLTWLSSMNCFPFFSKTKEHSGDSLTKKVMMIVLMQSSIRCNYYISKSTLHWQTLNGIDCKV